MKAPANRLVQHKRHFAQLILDYAKAPTSHRALLALLKHPFCKLQQTEEACEWANETIEVFACAVICHSQTFSELIQRINYSDENHRQTKFFKKHEKEAIHRIENLELHLKRLTTLLQ